MSVSQIAGELITEDSAEDDFKPGHIKTLAKYYKTDGSVEKAPIFTENDKVW